MPKARASIILTTPEASSTVAISPLRLRVACHLLRADPVAGARALLAGTRFHVHENPTREKAIPCLRTPVSADDMDRAVVTVRPLKVSDSAP